VLQVLAKSRIDAVQPRQTHYRCRNDGFKQAAKRPFAWREAPNVQILFVSPDRRNLEAMLMLAQGFSPGLIVKMAICPVRASNQPRQAH
jgi:hypothetical protein